MRISLNWLKDYLDIKPDVDIKDISESLTLAGIEVEGILYLIDKSVKLLLGVVKQVKVLSDSEAIYDLDHQGKLVSVIGPKLNITANALVAFKLFEEEKSKNRYAGTLASYADLGLSVGGNEPIILPPEYLENSPKNLSLIKEFDDVIFSLSITPNRADVLSHLGVSRELSALLDINPRSLTLFPKEMSVPTHEKAVIEIDNANDCPRYACRIIENVTIADSPFWMKLRLLSLGIRPINNVVDVTNYVMMSSGQPMHAFDFDKIHSTNGRAKIIVRRAIDKEKFVALNGQELTLTKNDLVISDQEKILALAGVIGGITSAVSTATKTVLLESAYFEPKSVRMTARKHGLSTESSYRFERGCDPNGVVTALNYAAHLLTEIIDVKVCREPIDAYRKIIDPLEIKLRPERAQAVLGIDSDNFDQDLLRKRFFRLGIETIAKKGDAIYFRVPTYRSDLTREIDLIEEAARMIGYDKVKATLVSFGFDGMNLSHSNIEMVIKKLKERLISRGFFETINYVFQQKDFQDHFLSEKDSEKLIEIKNPLSDRYGVMRMSLIPSLIRNLTHNQRNQEKSIQLFEVGTVFLGKREGGAVPNKESLISSLDQDSYCIEKQMIAGIMAGQTQFFAFDQPSRSFDFFHLKGDLIEALSAFGLSDQVPNENIVCEHSSSLQYLHPGESATIRYKPYDSNNLVTLGHFGKLHPHIATLLEVQKDVYLFELDVANIAVVMKAIPQFKPFARYPIIERDVAFLVDEDVNVSTIIKAVELVPEAKNTLLSIRVFDVYRGKNVEKSKKSIAVSLTLQKSDRTLVDEEAEDFLRQYIDIVKKETGAQLRQ